MNLSNCPRCGRLYVKSNDRLCPACLKEEEKQYELVKDYLKEHPHSLLSEVSEETGVDETTILKYVREGRISADGNVDLMVECERCGAPIPSGRFCEECADEIAQGFSNVGRKRTNVTEKMRSSRHSRR